MILIFCNRTICSRNNSHYAYLELLTYALDVLIFRFLKIQQGFVEIGHYPRLTKSARRHLGISSLVPILLIARLLPAELAFPWSPTTVNNSQQQSVTSEFGLVSLSAGGGGSPRVAIWVVGFRLCRLQRLWIGDFRGRRESARVRPGRRLWIGDFGLVIFAAGGDRRGSARAGGFGLGISPGRRRSLGVVPHTSL